MRVLVAGATGALGRRLVPLLIAAGHSVAGLTRSPAKLSLLQRMGAEAIVADALDPSAIKKCGLANKAANYYSRAHFYREGRPAKIDGGFAATNRLRKEGTDNLLAAARAAGVRRFVAQSFAGWPYAREGSFVKTEKDPLDPNPPPTFRHTLEAIRYLESAVISEALLEGIVLRYGAFYGPGTAIGEHGWMVNDIRNRRMPRIGEGGGIWSFIHIDDATRLTFAALTRGVPGIYNIVDDDPAPVSQWLPAEALGAKPPRRVPAWLARILIGNAVVVMTEARVLRTPRQKPSSERI